MIVKEIGTMIEIADDKNNKMLLKPSEIQIVTKFGNDGITIKLKNNQVRYEIETITYDDFIEQMKKFF